MNQTEQVKVGVGVIITNQNKTLLTKRINSHGENTFGSLGGHVEFGESLVEAVKREAMEELGIELESIEFLVTTNMVKYGKHYVDITFSAKIKSGSPQIKEHSKIASVDWYDLENLPSPLFEPVRIGLEALKTGQKYFEVN